jgi:DNA-binding GntR family transcriptional regulator
MPKSTAADHVFESVVADILAGVLRPGEQISERDLVTRFGVSRTPVREAIKRLFERGLVQAGAKGVAVVIEIGRDDLRKLYEVREQMEGHAAVLTAANITAKEIDELGRVNRQFGVALAKRDLVRMLDIRAQFHAILAHATRNRWLAEILIMLRDRAYVVRHFHWQDAERARETLRIHERMLAALQRRDARAYRNLVVRQITSAIECYEAQLRAPEPNRQRRSVAPGRRASGARLGGVIRK